MLRRKMRESSEGATTLVFLLGQNGLLWVSNDGKYVCKYKGNGKNCIHTSPASPLSSFTEYKEYLQKLLQPWEIYLMNKDFLGWNYQLLKKVEEGETL